MAEALAVVGGLASFSQILGIILTSACLITEIRRDIQDAPMELLRLKMKLSILERFLEQLRSFLTGIPEQFLLPLDLQMLLLDVMAQLHTDLQAIDDIKRTHRQNGPLSLRNRLRWVLIEKSSIGKLQRSLEDSERILSDVLTLINFRYSALIYQNICMPQYIQPKVSNAEHSRSPISTTAGKKFVYEVGSWLRKTGIYGYFVFKSGNSSWSSKICIGYHLPGWLCSKSVSVGLELVRVLTGEAGINLRSGYIRIQNRVPLGSPLMQACQNGDVDLIRQLLIDRRGNISDRTLCSGKTPLMLAIDGQHLEAMRVLLEAGADPNIGDDDQILPVFAVVGMNPTKSKLFPQLPPTWKRWVDALQLLVDHGASVHEVIGQRPLSTYNISRVDPGLNTVRFFRLLIAQDYMDFDVSCGRECWSALLSALRAKELGLEALKLLEKSGVNLARVFDDGRTPFHLAAEMSLRADIIEYLCVKGDVDHINRQDKWGWTPLHYSVMSHYWHYGLGPLDKVEVLLKRGANISIKGRSMPHVLHKDPSEEFDALELCKYLHQPLLDKILDIMNATDTVPRSSGQR